MQIILQNIFHLPITVSNAHASYTKLMKKMSNKYFILLSFDLCEGVLIYRISHFSHKQMSPACYSPKQTDEIN